MRAACANCAMIEKHARGAKKLQRENILKNNARAAYALAVYNINVISRHLIS